MARSEMKLSLPIGYEDFKEVREGGFYFADKSELISDLLSHLCKVFIFTRPRRFGKSLNLSMLDAFFNLKYKGNNWFDGLKINDHPEVEEYRNTHPVIFLSLKDLSYDTYEHFLSDFKYRIIEVYKEFSYLENSEKINPYKRIDYQDIILGTANESLFKYSLYRLTSMLQEHHGVKPIVLLDDYDHTLNRAYGKESFEDILEFLRSLYSSTFKGNEYLNFGVLTGVMQIPKAGICSGFNNYCAYSIFHARYNDRFGFTEAEIKELCAYYDHPERSDEAKEWYGGYYFDNTEIYNPSSVLKYIESKFIPDTYWSCTDEKDILDKVLKCINEYVSENLSALDKGDKIRMDLSSNVSIDDLGHYARSIYSVLVAEGYLNAIPKNRDDFLLSIPNREMKKVFDDQILNNNSQRRFPLQ